MTSLSFKKLAQKAFITSFAIGLIATSQTQHATAAATAPSPSAPSNTAPTPSGGEYRPMYTFISPDGHVVRAYEAIRSPEFCLPLFELGDGESNREQSRFWTQCILGGPINR